jgi:hypothetical protein
MECSLAAPHILQEVVWRNLSFSCVKAVSLPRLALPRTKFQFGRVDVVNGEADENTRLGAQQYEDSAE